MRFWNCRGIATMIARGDLEDASAPVRALVWLHLLFCLECRRYLRQIQLLALAARAWAGGLTDASRRQAFEDRLVERLSRPA